MIQRLFATGLSLQSTVRAIDDPAAAERVQDAVDQLDDTILQIRSTIFALQRPRVAGRGPRDEILALAADAAPNLGFEPAVRIKGLVERDLDGAVFEQLLAVLREALSNVVRHAGARRVAVEVVVADHDLIAQVIDDGVGFGTGDRPGGEGLASLHHRAAALGGTLELRAGAGGKGATMRWQVPLDRPKG